MAVSRSGNRINRAVSGELAFNASTNRLHCELLPLRSNPSNTIKAPRGREAESDEAGAGAGATLPDTDRDGGGDELEDMVRLDDSIGI